MASEDLRTSSRQVWVLGCCSLCSSSGPEFSFSMHVRWLTTPHNSSYLQGIRESSALYGYTHMCTYRFLNKETGLAGGGVGAEEMSWRWQTSKWEQR